MAIHAYFKSHKLFCGSVLESVFTTLVPFVETQGYTLRKRPCNEHQLMLFRALETNNDTSKISVWGGKVTYS